MKLPHDVIQQLSILPEEAVRWLHEKVLAWLHSQVLGLALPAPVRRPELVAGWQAPTEPGDLVRFERWLRTGERQWVFTS